MKTFGIIIIIVLILFLMYVLFFINQNDKKIHKYSEIKDKMKTGDVLLFSCKTHPTLFNHIQYYVRTNLLGSEFGHVGVVIRDKDELYFVECTDVNHTGDSMAKRLNNYGKGGVRIIKLDYLLEKYHKKYNGIFGIRFISREISNKMIFREIGKFKDKIFENKTKLLFLGFVDICISHSLASQLSNILSDNKRIMCSQYTHELLYNCGAVDKYKSHLFWPHLFDDGNVFDHLQKISYSHTYKFVFDK